MIAYKGFNKGLVCRGYKFKMGMNTTPKAQTVECGFHCAEDPLDCLSYYPNMNTSEYYIVDAGGDVDEDGTDTKISCTELNIIKRLTKEDFILHALAYIVDHPRRKKNYRIKENQGEADNNGFVIVIGEDPVARGKKGDILAFARNTRGGEIVEVSLAVIDGTAVLPDLWYGTDLSVREVQDK